MENKFEFSESKEGFDNHINNSIPGYDVLLNQTTILANHWLNDDELKVIDIGGSTGKLLNNIQQMSGIEIMNKFINIDPTVFKYQVENKYISFINVDANNYLENTNDKLQIAFSLFTLQFLNNENRQKIISEVSNKLDSNGAFFIAEKFYIEDSEYQELYSVTLREIKRNKFSDPDILNKDYKLLKHLKLKKEKDFYDEMSSYGFTCIKYWQSLHFNAFICTKK